MDRRSRAEHGVRATVREELHRVLLEGPLTVRDLSQRVGIPEHDLAEHLAHVERSLKHKGEALVVEPPACLDCDFTFTHRHRYTRPSTCPTCRSRRISLPRFHIAPARGANLQFRNRDKRRERSAEVPNHKEREESQRTKR